MLSIASTKREGRFHFVFLCVATLVIAGCGKGKGTVKGKILMGDNSIVSGRVTFHVGNDQASAPIKSDGTYEVNGVPVGSAKVTVTSPKPQAGPAGIPPDRAPPEMRDKMPKEYQDRMKGQPNAEAADPAKWIEIPEPYTNETKTPLTFEVKQGENDWDIKMKQDGQEK